MKILFKRDGIGSFNSFNNQVKALIDKFFKCCTSDVENTVDDDEIGLLSSKPVVVKKCCPLFVLYKDHILPSESLTAIHLFVVQKRFKTSYNHSLWAVLTEAVILMFRSFKINAISSPVKILIFQ